MPSNAINHFASLNMCSTKVSMSLDWSADVSCHKHCGKSRSKFYCRNYFTKMLIGIYKISESVNDSDSDGSSFSEISDSVTCAWWNKF
jgi:hypothetical protein